MSSKEYHRDYNRRRYHRLRNHYIEFLGASCIQCSSQDNLEFDHVNPLSKSFDISKLLNYSQDLVLAEVKKCQLLCKDCHTTKGILNRDYGGGHNKILDPSHGTWAMYTNSKCRCSMCRKWRSDYRKKIVDARGNILPL